ncbi:hypothetical protein PsorP6_013765 [Peronosclerospora sorghi]|uniref:Uncharacterized protein n=1 Tax=Peronosclerospora sorghi TaxID=230839 RepID=A0ACC0VH43_9STRA|nr:hypothetical protein PsorP6_013765 [Peronosclerospora sorghi]
MKAQCLPRKMVDKLAACAWQLFEGTPGSDEQRAANAWLMQYQKCEEAWEASLQLLRQPVLDPITHYPQVAPQLVALQILRLKIEKEWKQISVVQQQTLRQTLLLLLETACVSEDNLSAICCRIACVALADIVIKSFKIWISWKNDVQRLVNASAAAQNPQKGAAVLAGILGAIPLQIQASEKASTVVEMEEILTTFQAQAVDVLTVMQRILASIPNEKSNALRCLESWIVGCVPTHEEFGFTAAHLFSCGLLDVLFAIVIGDDEEQAQLAAGILADSFVSNTPIDGSERMNEAVLHIGFRLIEAMPFFRVDAQSLTGNIATQEHQTSVCKGLSRIACSLAMNHASVLFCKPKALTPMSFDNLPPEQFQRFSIDFIELLLLCTSHGNIDVAQPTLEIWFFFLETNSAQDELSWYLFDVTGKEHVISVLSRLVNTLIDHCKYPQWFVDRQLIVSDDPEIDSINDLRKEIADTMLSLFSKWPGSPDKPAGDYGSCVQGMSHMLSTCKDVALIDALFFLLSYTVELFDPISSDSESEGDFSSFKKPVSGGVEVLYGVCDCAPNLPVHPLVINSLARYLRSLSASHALPPSVYLRVSIPICQGLQCASSFPVAVQSLLQSSFTITKFTTIEERLPLLQTLLQMLLQTSSTLESKILNESKGDLLEVTFRLASGLSDADFNALCSSSLATFTVHVQSTNPIEASNSVYMLARALGGVQDPQHGSALITQLWPGMSTSLSQHSLDSACRRARVQFFLNAIPHLQREASNQVEAEILEICLCWYGKSLAPDILTCCSRIISRQRGNANFQASVEQTFERLLADFRRKLDDGSGVEINCRQLSIESFHSPHREADELIPEIEQFFKLTQEIMSFFPHVLLRYRRNGEPSLYWVCLDLATRLLQVDHQMQEVCDAACGFLLSAMRCQPEQILEQINVFATEVVRIILGLLGPKREHYRVRHFSDFLFQCLHAPQIPTKIRGKCFRICICINVRMGFLSAMSTVLAQGALRSVFSAEVCQQMPNELRMRRQRHRFLQYFVRLGQVGTNS